MEVSIHTCMNWKYLHVLFSDYRFLLTIIEQTKNVNGPIMGLGFYCNHDSINSSGPVKLDGVFLCVSGRHFGGAELSCLCFVHGQSYVDVYGCTCTPNYLDYNGHLSWNWFIWLWCTHNSQRTLDQCSTFLFFIININYCAPRAGLLGGTSGATAPNPNPCPLV